MGFNKNRQMIINLLKEPLHMDLLYISHAGSMEVLQNFFPTTCLYYRAAVSNRMFCDDENVLYLVHRGLW